MLVDRVFTRFWYCLQIHHKQDSIVQENIKRLGIEFFNPQSDEKSLFPGYMFVRFNKRMDHHWRTLWYIPGAKRILSSSPECPTQVPTQLIKHLQDLFPNPEDITCIDDYDLAPGELTRIINGPFRNLIGITQHTTHDRVRILLSMFGREHEFELHKKDVRPHATT